MMLVSLMVMGVTMVGCAKRPATTTAAAPAPTGVTETTASRAPEPATAAPAPSTAQPSGAGTAQPSAPAGGAVTTPATRPDVKTFTSVKDLNDIHFDFDKYDIRPGDARILDANAQWLKSNPNHLLLIEGHTDERGTNEYNLALGERRAKSAMNYLVAQGVQASRITIISYGEERPLCTEQTEACWARNRRDHFLVKPR
jgi:peptidoglycan-associated lipoprotein